MAAGILYFYCYNYYFRQCKAMPEANFIDIASFEFAHLISERLSIDTVATHVHWPAHNIAILLESPVYFLEGWEIDRILRS